MRPVPNLEFSADEMRRMADAVTARSIEHVASLGAQPVLGDVNGRGFYRDVDGAHGAFFNLCDEGRAVLKGLDGADSLTLDPHKGMFLPYGTGALLVRDGAALRAAHEATAHYLPAMPHPDDFYDPSQHGPDLSRGFPGFRVWLTVKLQGAAAYRAAIAEKRAPTRDQRVGERVGRGDHGSPGGGMDSNLFKTKSIEQLVSDVEHGDRALRRSLSAWDLTLLGIGAIIGTGIFVLTGTAAANQAGPAITMSYLAAGLACAFAALCYAEFASMIPIAGSAYTYAYATLGELVAWMIGWDLILEYAVGSMTVAIGWSGYMQRLLSGVGITLPTALSAAPPVGMINILAVLIVLAIMILLVIGVRESARANAVMVAVKLAAVLFFLAAGATYVKPENWSPFAPFGWSGIMGAAAVVFFAYIGFDAVSTTAEEAKNPKRDLPIGIITSLVVCTALYLAVAAVLSGIIPVIQYRSAADALPGVPMVSPEESVRFLNAPVAYALAVIGQDWASYLVSAGAVAGITSVLLVMLMSQPRIFFAMSRDGLLPALVSKVHPRFGTPYITTIITCVIVALVAGVTEIQVVGEMTSIGTLFAFVVVCASVLMLRVKRPDAHRPFRVPGGPIFPILGIVSCTYLMLSLPVITWVRFLVWLNIGFVIYWFYGRTHSPLASAEETRRRTPLRAVANFVLVFGALGLFNGVCMFLLGLLTELGVTTETTAKWAELDALTTRFLGVGVTAETADTFGLQVLGIGVAVFVAGWVLAKVSGEK
jgi:basic amino acid/polyamine antiporter, APA family